MNHTITNKEIAFLSLVGAVRASHILTDLHDTAADIFGEDAPITQAIDEANQHLSAASDTLYNIGYNSIAYMRPDGPDPKHFLSWISDDRPLGPCSHCSHAIPDIGPNNDPDQAGHWFCCDIHGGTMSSDYSCYDFSQKDK